MIYKVTINDKLYEVEVEEGKANLLNTKTVQISEDTASAQVTPKSVEVSVPTASSDAITAPMPGVVIEIKVTKGQKVKENDLLMILEAMKMENEVFAKKNGTVADIYAAKGKQVNTGDPLILIL